MELKNSVKILILSTFIAVLICEISSYPTPEDYDRDQGVRDMLEALERQGGLSGPMVPRATYVFRRNPNHRMMRKSQRSSALRLRFGKRSAPDAMLYDDDDVDNGFGQFVGSPVNSFVPASAAGALPNNNIAGQQLSGLKNAIQPGSGSSEE